MVVVLRTSSRHLAIGIKPPNNSLFPFPKQGRENLPQWCLKVPISPHRARREGAIVQRDLLPKRWWPFTISVTQPDELGGAAGKDWLGAKSKALSASWATEYQPWVTLCCLLSAHCWIKQMWSLKPMDPTVKSWIIEKEKMVKESGVRNVWLNEDWPEAPSALVQGFLNVAFHYSNTQCPDLCQVQGHTLEFHEQTIDECKWSGF